MVVGMWSLDIQQHWIIVHPTGVPFRGYVQPAYHRPLCCPICGEADIDRILNDITVTAHTESANEECPVSSSMPATLMATFSSCDKTTPRSGARLYRQ